MKIKWTPDLKIGHDLIDSQHKELFNKYDEFMEGCSSGKGKESVSELYQALKEYTEIHFRDEEDLMTSSGYPEREQHEHEHQKLHRRVSELGKTISQQGINLMDLVNMNKLLVDWLVTHVQNVDQKLGKYLQEITSEK